MKKALIVLVLVLIFSSVGMAATYRVGGTTAGGFGFEYRTDAGLGLSLGLVNPSKDLADLNQGGYIDDDQYLSLGIRKMHPLGTARPYIGGAVILNYGYKAEVGLQFNILNLAINPGINLHITADEMKFKPGLGLALEW